MVGSFDNVNNDEWRTAGSAHERWLFNGLFFGAGFFIDKQPGQVLFAPAVGEQTEVANTMKALWQDMNEESSNKLISRKPHGLITVFPLGSVVLPLEGH